MVYLDHNATTPLAPEAREAMLPFLEGDYGNPSSIHSVGRRARAAVDDARDRMASLLGAKAHEIIFTSGGTESCNLGLIGLARAHVMRGRHLIVSAVEHHAVLHAADHLQHFEGLEITRLPVDSSGIVDPSLLARLIRKDTTVVSIMHANNETGVLQPLAEIAAVCAGQGVFFHTDAVQTFGKIAVSAELPGLSAISIAAHKFYGPKGAGLLYLRGGIALSRTAYGGSHENSRRPGTENVAALAGMAAAAEAATRRAASETARLAPLRERLWEGIHAACPHAIRNGDVTRSLPNTLNVSFPGADGEALLMGLDLEGICVSSGSACMVGSIQPSHVLIAMGVDPGTALATVRFSLGHSTDERDIDLATAAVGRVVKLQPALAA
ncbi:MAG: cysteine desulfurase family protein [bacterium]